MIKKGLYCKMNNNEYKLSKNIKGDTLIITKNKRIIDETFIDKYGSGVYTKFVEEKELDEIYEINTIGKIGELVVNVEKEFEDSYLVGTSNLEIAQKLGLEQCDKYYHQGKILKENIIIKEEKVRIK